MAKQKEPKEYNIKGVSVSCPICQYDRFWEGKAQLNTAMATFLNFDWANRQVLTLSCARCTHILWFDQDR